MHGFLLIVGGLLLKDLLFVAFCFLFVCFVFPFALVFGSVWFCLALVSSVIVGCCHWHSLSLVGCWLVVGV